MKVLLDEMLPIGIRELLPSHEVYSAARMLGEPTPHDADPTGSHYAFEKRVTKAGGGEGFADVWKRDFFAWEYKGSYRDLRAAYVQLLGYKDDLGNPPLLIVSDMERIERARLIP